MVTVAAGSCLDANAASTAAIVWGDEGPFRLAQLGLPARFVGADGRTVEVGGWPTPGADDSLAPMERTR
jgi:thiamine biosynthesis lipoprotein